MTLIVMAPGWPGDAFMNAVSIGFCDKYFIISVFQKMWYRVASRWIMYMQLYLFQPYTIILSQIKGLKIEVLFGDELF